MDAEEKPTNYLELKEFLARNPCVKPRTFTRWKKRGQIDFIQPGGPNTEILVPEDALVRIEQRKRKASQSGKPAEASKTKLKGVRQPNWMKQPKQTKNRKEKDG